MLVTEFNKQFKQDYARANLFQVSIANFDTSRFVVKAAQIPATTVNTIEVPFMNRKIKVPGDRTFADWTVTVMQDEGGELRKHLLEWQNSLQHFDDAASDGTDGSPVNAHKSMEISPLNRDGSVNSGGTSILQAWPQEIGSIDLSWDNADTVSEFTVTFAVTWNNAA